MIKNKMKLCWLAAFLLVVSLVDLSAQCNPSLSGDWSGMGTTYDSSLGTNSVSFDSPSEPGANDTSFSPNGTFNAVNDNYWSNPDAEGANSLQFTINWDDTPDSQTSTTGAVTFDVPAEDDAVTRTVTITYATAVQDPIIHIDRLGGNYTTLDGVEPYVSNSTEWTLTTPGITINRLSGNPQFIVAGNVFYREPNVTLNIANPGSEADGTDGTDGTAAGSIQFIGVVTTLTFDVTGIGVEATNAIDGIEMIFDADLAPIADIDITPNPSCEGLELVGASNSIYNEELDITFEWAIDGVVVSTSENTALTFPAGGTYEVTFTVSDGGCSDSVTQTVSVSAADDPSVEITGTFDECGGDSVMFTSDATTDTSIESYEWVVTLPDGSTQTSTEPDFSVETGDGDVNAVLTVTNAIGCVSTATTTINVMNMATDVVIEDITGCAGDDVTAMIDVPAGATITFDPSTGVTFADGVLTASVGEESVDYIYTVTNGSCVSEGTFSVVSLFESIDVLTEATACGGETIVLLEDFPTGYTIESTPEGAVEIVGGDVVFVGSESADITHTITSTTGCVYTAVTAVTVIDASSDLSVVNAADGGSVDGGVAACVSSSVSLTAVGEDGATYSWESTGDVTITMGADEVTVTATVDSEAGGTLTVTAISAEGCTSSITTVVNADSDLTITLDENIAACVGSSATVFAFSDDGTTYVWTADGDITIVAGADAAGVTVTVDSDAGGTLTVTGVSPAGCTGTATVAVGSLQADEIMITADGAGDDGNSGAACIGSSSSYTVSGATDASYAWVAMGDISILGSADTETVEVAFNGDGGGELFVTATSADGCVSTTSVTVAPLETPELDFPDTILACEGQGVELPLDGDLDYTFVVNGEGSVVNGVYTFPLASTGSGAMMVTNETIDVTVGAGADCNETSEIWEGSGSSISSPSGNTTVTVDVPNTPGASDISYTPNGTFNTVNAGYWSQAVEGATSLEFLISWDSSPESGGDDATDDAVSRMVTISFDNPTDNPILHIDRLGGNGENEGIFSSNTTIWTLMTPGVSVSRLSGNSQFIVQNNAFWREPGVVLGSANPGSEADGPTGTAAGSVRFDGTVTDLTFMVTAAGVEGIGGDGIEFIVGAAGAGCCTATATINVEVTPNPLSPANTPIMVCQGDAATLNPDALAGYEYSWTANPAFAFDDPTAGTQVVTVSETTVFTATAVSFDSGCTFTETITVVPADNPIGMNSDDAITLCPGETYNGEITADQNVEVWCYYTYTGSGNMPVTVFTGSGVTTGSGGSWVYPWMFTDTGSGSGFVTKEFFGVETGCSSSITIPVIINDADVFINADDMNPTGQDEIVFCQGDEVTLTASSDQGIVSTVWTDMDGNEIGTDNPLTFTPGGPMVVTVTSTLANGCMATNSIILTPIDLMVGITSSTGDTYCPGEEVTLTADVDPEDLIVTWVCSDGTTFTGNPLVTTPEGVVECTATVMQDGCEDSATFTLTPFESNLAVTTTDAVICPGEEVTMTATADEDCDLLWSTGETTDMITVSPTETTEYTVTCTSSDGCVSTVSVIVTVSDAPDVIADLSPDTYEENSGDSSTLTVTNPDADCSYEWFDAAGNSIGTGESVVVSPQEEGSYDYTVVCTTVDGCTSQDTVTLTVTPEEEPVDCSDSDIYIPNTFSPNADATNDDYLLFNETSSEIQYEILIVDRWGECMYRFDGTDFGQGWDGTYEGEQLNPDVYGYCVRWTCPNDEDTEYVKTGNITLVR